MRKSSIFATVAVAFLATIVAPTPAQARCYYRCNDTATIAAAGAVVGIVALAHLLDGGGKHKVVRDSDGRWMALVDDQYFHISSPPQGIGVKTKYRVGVDAQRRALIIIGGVSYSLEEPTFVPREEPYYRYGYRSSYYSYGYGGRAYLPQAPMPRYTVSATPAPSAPARATGPITVNGKTLHFLQSAGEPIPAERKGTGCFIVDSLNGVYCPR
jgi:hypothetical protein